MSRRGTDMKCSPNGAVEPVGGGSREKTSEKAPQIGFQAPRFGLRVGLRITGAPPALRAKSELHSVAWVRMRQHRLSIGLSHARLGACAAA
jgi:hypothetical protein